ncbi:MAG: ATP-binding protein [Myxococcota bacterium]
MAVTSRWLRLEDAIVAGLPPDDARRGRAAVRFAAGVAPWGFLFTVAFVAAGQPALAVSLLLAGLGVGSGPLVLRTTGSVAVTAHWMNATLAQSLLVCAWNLDGVVAACVPWLLVTVATASFLSGPRAGFAWTALSCAGVSGLLLGHLLGTVPEPIVPPTMIWLLATGADCGLLIVGFVLVTAGVAVNDRARAELEQADLAKSAFLAQMSHELRTPMNAVLGYAELLAEDATAEQRDDLARISAAGEHLLDLVNDVLDLSKVSAGRMVFSAEPVDLVALAHDVIDASAPLLEARSNRGVVDDGPPLVVLADPLRARQVLLNLVSNASKFTLQGTVRIGFERAEGRARVFVEDTGIGIPAEQLDRIFDAFTQASGDIQRSYGGTGLGLALVREFAERMGGGVAVRSVPGQGSCFTVTLPAA